VEQIRADVLVAGGGMSGLLAAERARMAGASVAVLTGLPGASIRMAGFATALREAPGDRPEDLFTDMFIGGGFVNNRRLLAAIVARIETETRFFESLDIPFQREPGGTFARRQASGVSAPRAVYTTDMVGDQVGKVLLQRLRDAGEPEAFVIGNGFLVDLDVRSGTLCGGLVHVPSEQRWVHVAAPAVVLGTGGAGRLFRNSTNFRGSTGMGFAMALEAGAELVDMEFVSFEPTVAVGPPKAAGMELPTMAFSDGARLRNAAGEEFITTMPPASKDVMSRAIMYEVAEGRGLPSGGVFYDMRHMEPDVATSYQQLRRVLRALGVPPTEAMVEVAPAQHYMMGGIKTDADGMTRVPGLFAVGETAGGSHGAHRLATCGGTDAIAMGALAGEAAARFGRSGRTDVDPMDENPALLEGEVDDAGAERLGRMADALESGCGVLRNREDVTAAVSVLDDLWDEIGAEGAVASFVGRSVLVARAIAMSARARQESRGDHFRTDFPERDDVRWFGNLVAILDGDLDVSFHEIG